MTSWLCAQWQRLRAAAWLWFCCHVWLPWLFYKHRRRQRH